MSSENDPQYVVQYSITVVSGHITHMSAPGGINRLGHHESRI